MNTAQRGFSLIELVIATAVLMFGLVAVVKLVPAAARLNQANRNDSSAMVYAQRELSQMLRQPMGATFFTDADNHVCQLGNPATPNVVVGSPVVTVGNVPQIDFTQATVAGYNFTYIDPNDPSMTGVAAGGGYEVRWAVITVGSGGAVSSKRFILGVRRVGGNGPLAPVNMDAWASR